jgi:hydroxyacylglutathione hydrolase
VDIRNDTELADGPIFEHAMHIPLPNLRDLAHTIPSDKPIVIHCAGGYRSAAGASIVRNVVADQTVYDLSTNINDF